jgi:opacity protein-like surface antigen
MASSFSILLRASDAEPADDKLSSANAPEVRMSCSSFQAPGTVRRPKTAEQVLARGAMRKLILLLVGLLVLGITAVAQDAAKAEIFGGYQYLRVNPGQGFSSENFNGWNGAVTGYVNNWLGITGDISGSYSSGINIYTFMGGPTISPAREKKVAPFVHALFGDVRASGGGISDNAFGMALGGGVDLLGLHGHIGVRLAQADYLMSRFGSATQNNFRYSAGVVFRF